MIQPISQPHSKTVQAGAACPVMSGTVGLPIGIARLEHAWPETKLQNSAMLRFSGMRPCTKLGYLGYLDQNLIQRRSTTASDVQKV